MSESAGQRFSSEGDIHIDLAYQLPHAVTHNFVTKACIYGLSTIPQSHHCDDNDDDDDYYYLHDL